MKATKMKSGLWRARYVDHYERDATGKRKVVYSSVTAPTEFEAVRQAMQLTNSGKQGSEITVSFAIAKYIELKSAVLSPSTLRSYKALEKNAYNDISSVTLSALTSAIIQSWIAKYSLDHSPKATANAHGLLMAVVGMFLPDVHFRVSLPKRTPPDLYTPTEEEVKTLLEEASRNNRLYKAITLAAYGLRRGEICALTYSDIDAQTNTISISKDMVRSDKKEWVIKEPKTPQSIRTVVVATEAVSLLLSGSGNPDDLIIGVHPDAITNAFRRLVVRLGMEQIRFHDLRSFSASLQHAIGVPDQYIMKTHGWKTDYILKQVYRRTMSDKEEEFAKAVQNRMSHFTPKNV